MRSTQTLGWLSLCAAGLWMGFASGTWAQETQAITRGEPDVTTQPMPVMLPQIVAHRGASADAPENTLAAFRLGWEQAADAIEGDFFLTSDETVVALHDSSTKRTAGVDWDVRKKTVAELKTLDVGRWKHRKFELERIPTLAEVLQIIPPGKQLFLEIKDSPRIVPFVKQALAADPKFASSAKDQVKIIAFDADVIAACKREIPDIKAFWLTSFKPDESTGEIRPTVDEILTTLHRIGADGLDCKAADHIDQTFVDRIRAAGYQFHVWTVDDPKVAKRFADLGVDSITTNVPQAIRQQLLPHSAKSQ